MKRISVVIPVFNEEQVLLETHRRLTDVFSLMEDYEYEFIFVNDGSKDQTFDLLELISEKDNHVKVIDFTRNFGQQFAVTAGVNHTIGDAVILIDADLQDPPELIPNMVKKWEEGFEVVYAVRKVRKGEKRFKLFTSGLFYRVLKKIIDIDIPLDTGDFRLMDRCVVEHLKELKEHHRFVRGLVSWAGYKQIGIPYDRSSRYAGTTKWTFRKLSKLAMDAVTSFSFKPLILSTRIGIFASLIGFLGLLATFYIRFFTHIEGWSFTPFLILFMGGLQFLFIGMIGEYLGRMYDEVRERPLYLIRKRINFEPKIVKGEERVYEFSRKTSAN